jgi:hypothetical protein
MLEAYLWWYIIPVVLLAIGWGIKDALSGPWQRLTDPRMYWTLKRCDVMRGLMRQNLETAGKRVSRQLKTEVLAVDDVDIKSWEKGKTPFPLRNSSGKGYVVVTLKADKIRTVRWSDYSEDWRVFGED